ncbi:hypothetical protein AGMMS50276_03910 [Synergistales bacterium]|nr:hypothetical protein AGMMS50276_03910 [Synergistales bacterium]
MTTSTPAKSYTLYHSRLAKQLRSEVHISNSFAQLNLSNPASSGGKAYTAIWDTGATVTCITQKVVDDLGLVGLGKCKNITAGGAIETTRHLIDLWLPNKVVILKCDVTKVELYALKADVLIGMDVISQGDFTITNYQGKTVMTFRIPSLETVDYDK